MSHGKSAFIIREGSASVIAYKLSRPNQYCLCYRKHAGAARTREVRTGEKAARARAREIAIALANGRAEVLELTHADRDSYLHAKAMLPAGVPIHAALEEWLVLRKQKTERVASPPAAQILEELLCDLADHQRSKRHIDGLRRDLAPFVRNIERLEEAREPDITQYLRSRSSGPRRRDNIRDAIVQLFRFARRRSYLPEDRRSVPERIGKIKSGHDVQTWTPREAAMLLEHCSPVWLPWLAISLFAGLRTSEILRLDWSAVKFDQRVIAVPRTIARKTRISRLVPIADNLLAWLSPFAGAVGPIYPGNLKTNENAKSAEMKRIRKLLGLPRRDNANRHSFGSYRLAVVKSYEQVAIEMNNSPRQVRENYNDPKPQAEGEAYFKLAPPSETSAILPLRFG